MIFNKIFIKYFGYKYLDTKKTMELLTKEKEDTNERLNFIEFLVIESECIPKALQNANKVIKRLDKETSLVFDDIQVLLISAITPVGRFAGVDNNGLNVFQASFKIIICDY